MGGDKGTVTGISMKDTICSFIRSTLPDGIVRGQNSSYWRIKVECVPISARWISHS